MKKIGIIFLLPLLLSCYSGVFGQEINWISFDELEAAQAKVQKKVMVDIYTDWCGWCKRMDTTTFTDPQIIAYLNKNYHCVKLDGEHKESLTFKGREYKFVPTGRRGYNELPSELMGGRLSYPTIVILKEDWSILQAFPGYKPASDLLPILTYLGEDIYLTTTWDAYSKGD
jgi:thioredoxin-related protein